MAEQAKKAEGATQAAPEKTTPTNEEKKGTKAQAKKAEGAKV